MNEILAEKIVNRAKKLNGPDLTMQDALSMQLVFRENDEYIYRFQKNNETIVNAFIGPNIISICKVWAP